MKRTRKNTGRDAVKPRKRVRRDEIQNIMNADEDGFTDAMLDQVTKLCKIGLNNKELAEALGYHPDTIASWINKYEQFQNAVMRGRVYADAEVAATLYKMATGEYEHEVEEPKWNHQRQEYEVVRYNKKYASNVTAAIKWMNVRQKNRWSEKAQVEHQHTVTHQKFDELPKNELSEDTQKYLDEITDKQLENAGYNRN